MVSTSALSSNRMFEFLGISSTDIQEVSSGAYSTRLPLETPGAMEHTSSGLVLQGLRSSLTPAPVLRDPGAHWLGPLLGLLAHWPASLLRGRGSLALAWPAWAQGSPSFCLLLLAACPNMHIERQLAWLLALACCSSALKRRVHHISGPAALKRRVHLILERQCDPQRASREPSRASLESFSVAFPGQ